MSDLKRQKHEAIRHGITIGEAKERCQTRINTQTPDIAQLLLRHFGPERLDEAAKSYHQTRYEYAARFVSKEDPIAAEHFLYNNRSKVKGPSFVHENNYQWGKKPHDVALQEERMEDAQREEESATDRAQRRKAWRENDLRAVYED